MRVGAFEIVEPVPELHNTCAIAMLRPWIDVGRVGTLVLSQLEAQLGAKELGRLARPGDFFDFTRYRPRMSLVEGQRVFTMPNSIVHYVRDPGTERDYLFLHLREPHAIGEAYAEAIVELANYFNVTEYCRIGGMYDSVPHTRPLLVTGTLGEEQASRAAGLISTRKNTYQGPTSIVNLVADTLMEQEVATSSLMAHLPQYVQLDEDHMGASRLMEVLSAVYRFPASFVDRTQGERQYTDLSRAVENNGEVKKLITQLEVYYDRVLIGPQAEEENPRLSPDVERFLQEMGERLDQTRDDE